MAHFRGHLVQITPNMAILKITNVLTAQLANFWLFAVQFKIFKVLNVRMKSITLFFRISILFMSAIFKIQDGRKVFSNSITNVIIEFLDPKNIYFDTRITILSDSEAEICMPIDFSMAAIWKIQNGRHLLI